MSGSERSLTINTEGHVNVTERALTRVCGKCQS